MDQKCVLPSSSTKVIKPMLLNNQINLMLV